MKSISLFWILAFHLNYFIIIQNDSLISKRNLDEQFLYIIQIVYVLYIHYRYHNLKITDQYFSPRFLSLLKLNPIGVTIEVVLL